MIRTPLPIPYRYAVQTLDNMLSKVADLHNFIVNPHTKTAHFMNPNCVLMQIRIQLFIICVANADPETIFHVYASVSDPH